MAVKKAESAENTHNGTQPKRLNVLSDRMQYTCIRHCVNINIDKYDDFACNNELATI